jgi:Arc/MetJ family transcription regulator
MRTTIEIDDELLADAMQLTGLATKRETVQLALEELVRMKQQRSLLHLRIPDEAWDPAFLQDIEDHRAW